MSPGQTLPRGVHAERSAHHFSGAPDRLVLVRPRTLYTSMVLRAVPTVFYYGVFLQWPIVADRREPSEAAASGPQEPGGLSSDQRSRSTTLRAVYFLIARCHGVP